MVMNYSLRGCLEFANIFWIWSANFYLYNSLLKQCLYFNIRHFMAKKNNDKSSPNSPLFGKYKWEGLIFFFAFFLYVNCIPNGYNMDDELVTINHRLTSKGISAIPEIFTSTYYKDAMGYAYEYRPVVLTSFAIEHEVFGDKPFVSHFINVMLYGLCCILLFRVLLRIMPGGNVLVPVAITLLFAAHPAHTEIVCSIKNRDEILGFIFSLLTCLTAFKVVNNFKWIWLLPLLFTIALMSKLSVLPFVLIIPMTIILFTNAEFAKVMAVTFLLALSSFFVLTNPPSEKLFITAGFLIAAVVMFIVFRIEYVLPLLKFPKYWKAPDILKSGAKAESVEQTNFNSFISSVKIDSGYFHFRSMAVVLTGAIFILSGLFSAFAPLIVIGFGILLAVIAFGREKNVWWSVILIYIAAVSILVRYHCVNNQYGDLLLISIFYQILYGSRKLFLPLLFIFLISLFVIPFGNVIGVMIALITARWMWTRLITFTVLAFTVHDFYVTLSTSGFVWEPFLFYSLSWYLFSVMLIACVLIKRGSKQILLTFQALTIALFIYMYMFHNVLINEQNNFKQNVVNVAGRFNTNIITGKQDRPLNFVEQPLTWRDPWTLRAGTSAEVLGLYLYKVVFPYPMAFYYGYKFISPQNISQPVPLISICLYALLLALALYCLRRHKLISFGLFIYLISIASVSGYLFPIPGQLGERFLFIPSVGWCIVFVVTSGLLFGEKLPARNFSFRHLPVGYKYGFLALLIMYSGLTFSRNFDWKDNVTLMKHDIDYVQNSSQANNLLALSMMKKSYELPDPASQNAYRIEALGHFKKALEIYPRFYNVAYDIGRVYSILGPPDSTLAYFNLALALDSSNTNPSLFIAETLIGQGKFAEAVPYLQYVIRKRPADYEAYDKLSFVYFKLGDNTQSITTSKSAIAAVPGQAAPYVNVARVYISLNETDSARSYLQKAMQLNPNDQGARNMLMQLDRH
jgi:hypothetical protein